MPYFTSGYPDFVRNSTKLDEYYGDLEIDSNSFVVNDVRLQKFVFMKQLQKFGKTADKTK